MKSGCKRFAQIIASIVCGLYGLLCVIGGVTDEDISWLIILGLILIGISIFSWYKLRKQARKKAEYDDESDEDDEPVDSSAPRMQNPVTAAQNTPVNSTHCPSCKAPLEEGMYFCGKCGTRVR